ncbi:hypothetical protein LCGC14_3046020, partial [marine sediment metagenome]
LVHTLSFPVQEHKLGPERVTDPLTGGSAGVIVSIHDVEGRLELRRGPSLEGAPLARALIPTGPYSTDQQRAALRRLAAYVADNGPAGAGSYRALRDILARGLPRVRGHALGDPLQDGSIHIDRGREIVSDLDESYLFIQGPPGSGKTWTAARLITHLMREGKRVGVAAQSHKAIHKLLEEVEQAADEEGLEFRGLKKSTNKEEQTVYEGRFIRSSPDSADFPPADDVQLVAGTAWLHPRAEMDEALDYLFIDEAGQVSLADALAMGTAAHNVVLIGDPLQLAQVSQGVHPGAAAASVLEHLLGDDATIPPERGLFLDRSRRMHPDVCEFISDVVYAGRLGSIDECGRQSVESGGLS